jgi:hypothetical protein
MGVGAAVGGSGRGATGCRPYAAWVWRPGPGRVRSRPPGRYFLPTLTVLAVSMLSTTPAHPGVEAALTELNRRVEFERVAISPDAQRLAWVEAAPTPAGPSGRLKIVRLADRSGGAPVRITAAHDGADHEEDEPVFSPDGKRLAFLSDAERAGQPQLYLADVASGAIRKLTQAAGHLERPRWSPDGKRLAVLYLKARRMRAVRPRPRSGRPGSSAPWFASSASRSCPWTGGLCRRCRPTTCSSTSTTGAPTAPRLPPPARTDRATTTGGPPSCCSSLPRVGWRGCSIIRRCRSANPPGARTGSASPSSRA